MRILLAFALAAASAFAQQNTITRELSCVTATASGTAYACSALVTPSAYVSGVLYKFKADVANTGPATINFNSLGAKAIKSVVGGITTALAANDIRAGQWVFLAYDGTNMQMVSQLGNSAGGGSSSGITYCADATGSLTAYTCPSASGYTLTAGARATFIPQTANSGTTPTVAIQGGAAKTIKNADSSALSIGQLLAGVPYDLEYNGTDQLLMGIGTSGVIPSAANDMPGANIVNGTFTISVPNASSTGTTANRLASLTGNPGTAVITGASATSGVIGCVVSGAGTTGNARIVQVGFCNLDADGATTAEHWAKPSATVGKITDTGTAITSAAPSGSIGIIQSTNGGAGAYSVLMALGAQGGGSGGGSGAAYTRGVYASAPACGGSQTIYNATDAALTAYCDGSSNQDWKYKGVTVTPTVTGDLGTWFNQGGAAVTTYPGSWLLTGTTGGGDTWRGRYKTTPATPYSIVTCMEGLTGAANFAGFGAFWTDGTKMITTAIQNQVANTPGVIGILKFTNSSTYSGAYLAGNTAVTPSGMFCIALVDDGTNRKEKFSYDGVNWTLLHTVGRTDFLTATGAGVIVEDGANSGLAAQVQVVSVVTLASAL